MANPGKELSSIDFKSLIGGPLVAVVEAQAQAALSTVNFIRSVGFKPGAPSAGDDPNDVPTTGEPIYVSFKYPKEIAPYAPATDPDFSVTVTDGGAGYTKPKVTITGGGGSGAEATAVLDNGKIARVEFTSLGKDYKSPPTVKVTEDGTPGEGYKEATVNVEFTPGKPATPAVFQEMKLEVPILSIVPIPYLRVEEATIDFNAKINSVQSYEATSERNFAAETSTSGKGGFLFASASVSMKASISNKSASKATGTTERTYSMAIHVRAVQDELPGGMEKILGILEDAIKSQPAAITT